LYKNNNGEYEKIILNKIIKIGNEKLEQIKNNKINFYFFDIYKVKE